MLAIVMIACVCIYLILGRGKSTIFPASSLSAAFFTLEEGFSSSKAISSRRGPTRRQGLFFIELDCARFLRSLCAGFHGCSLCRSRPHVFVKRYRQRRARSARNRRNVERLQGRDCPCFNIYSCIFTRRRRRSLRPCRRDMRWFVLGRGRNRIVDGHCQ